MQIGHIYIYAHLTEIVKGTYWDQCQLDVDTQSLAFQATIGHCSEKTNKYAHRLSQLTSKSEFKYMSFTALQYTCPMDNEQCPRLQNCMYIAHERRLASSGKCSGKQWETVGNACQVSAPSSPDGVRDSY